MKLSKEQSAAHLRARDLARSGKRLTSEEQEFILRNFHEGAEHLKGMAGAFFTPLDLALSLQIEVPPGARVLDLCAGIGALSWGSVETAEKVVCVESNPDYVAIGRGVVPEATWLNTSCFDLEAIAAHGPYDVVVSNPPFGRIREVDYRGACDKLGFHFKVIDVASRMAAWGVFILPANSLPFTLRPNYATSHSKDYQRFNKITGLSLEPTAIDASFADEEWRDAKVKCEVAVCDFRSNARRLPLAA